MKQVSSRQHLKLVHSGATTQKHGEQQLLELPNMSEERKVIRLKAWNRRLESLFARQRV